MHERRGPSAVDAFLDALRHARTLLESDEIANRWSSPSALEGFTVGGLATHLLQAAGRTEDVLEHPPEGGPELRVSDWYGLARLEADEDREHGLHRAIRSQAEEASHAGADQVVADFGGLVDRLEQRRDDLDPGQLASPLLAEGTTPLGDYLATRIIELLVHTDDLAVSVGVEPPGPPPAAARTAVATLVGVATDRRGHLTVLRALTRTERADPDVLRVL